MRKHHDLSLLSSFEAIIDGSRVHMGQRHSLIVPSFLFPGQLLSSDEVNHMAQIKEKGQCYYMKNPPVHGK
jgi:hypothetical protein